MRSLSPEPQPSTGASRSAVTLWGIGAAVWGGCAVATTDGTKDSSQPALVPLSQYTGRTIEGFATLWHPDCERGLATCREAEAAASEDLRGVKERVPCAASRVLQAVPIVFSLGLPEIAGTPGWDPRYRPRSPKWFAVALWYGLGEDRLGVVEIADSAWYTEHRWQDPAVLLHELAHAYLERSGARDEVQRVFERAKASGRYETVRERGRRNEQRTGSAYALTNSDEYFAELSEAYFWTNNWYPFTRSELREFDPVGADVVRRVWVGDGDETPCVAE